MPLPKTITNDKGEEIPLNPKDCTRDTYGRENHILHKPSGRVFKINPKEDRMPDEDEK